jgi:hypothetical protein
MTFVMHHLRPFRSVLLSLLLLTSGVSLLAQQEVDPDHFDGTPSKTTRRKPDHDQARHSSATGKKPQARSLAHAKKPKGHSKAVEGQ